MKSVSHVLKLQNYSHKYELFITRVSTYIIRYHTIRAWYVRVPIRIDRSVYLLIPFGGPVHAEGAELFAARLFFFCDSLVLRGMWEIYTSTGIYCTEIENHSCKPDISTVTVYQGPRERNLSRAIPRDCSRARPGKNWPLRISGRCAVTKRHTYSSLRVKCSGLQQ